MAYKVDVKLPKIPSLGITVAPPGAVALVKAIRSITGWGLFDIKRAIQRGDTLRLSINEAKFLDDAILTMSHLNYAVSR
jgi:hypothetical protein